MLEIDALSVRFGSGAQAVTAVDAVDLTVPDGEVLALLGPSGCGKSTLLRAIAGIERPTAGHICWDGTDLVHTPIHRRRFGLMFQDGALFPHRTVAGNIGYGLPSGGDRPAEIDHLLELVGLPGYGQRRIHELSGGQAQRVALARALAAKPRLLLLDEPLAALDAALRGRMLEVIREVLDTTGTTAVFVTHDQQEAFAVADTVALMRDGRIHQRGAPVDLWRAPLDEWSARFVGYQLILPAAHGIRGLPRGPLALRPSALRVVTPAPSGSAPFGSAPAGTAAVLAGVVSRVRATPDGVVLAVRVGGHLLPAMASELPEIGDEVRLTVDPAGMAPLPTDPGPAQRQPPS
ncbi:ABC transporter ATP-binding protein [Nakamurella sp. A5-74]|uniref:ABC-type quaternary amine transporter n=1 Tax=Nakamurella sp. A5-74 TaxID=3158264 RepID=A0AAU8DM25_9ACTN